MLSAKHFVLFAYSRYKSLSYIWFENTFSQAVICLDPLSRAFHRTEVFNFDEIYLPVFVLGVMSLLSTLRILFVSLWCQDFLLWPVLEISQFYTLHLSVWSILSMRFRSWCFSPPPAPLPPMPEYSSAIYWKSDPSSVELLLLLCQTLIRDIGVNLVLGSAPFTSESWDGAAAVTPAAVWWPCRQGEGLLLHFPSSELFWVLEGFSL